MTILPQLVQSIKPQLDGAHSTQQAQSRLRSALMAVAFRLAQQRGLPTMALTDAAEIELPSLATVDAQALGQLYTALMPHRREQGSYYTPPALAQRVMDQTLSARPLNAHIRILDPAMGSGDFLIAAGEALTAHGLSKWEAAACLHGVDIDPLAVELAAISIWLWAAEPNTTHLDLPSRLTQADFLLDNTHEPTSTDYVVGNPPFISVFTRHSTEAKAYRQQLKERYQTARGSFDLTVPFVEASVRVCKPDGRVGLVLPNKLLAASYAQTLREWLQTEAQIALLEDASTDGDFDAAVYPIVAVIEKAQRKDMLLQVQRGARRTAYPQADLALLPGNSWSGVFDDQWEQAKQCLENTVPLGEVTQINAGLTVGEAYDLKPYIFEHNASTQNNVAQLLTTGVIQRYQSLWASQPVRFLKGVYQQPLVPLSALPARRREQATQPKLVIAGLGQRPRVLLDQGGGLASVSTVIITQSDWPIEALYVLLNSDRVAWLYRVMYGALALSGGYLRFGKRELIQFPIPDTPADDPRLLRLVDLHHTVIEANEGHQAIEQIVDTLYGLSQR